MNAEQDISSDGALSAEDRAILLEKLTPRVPDPAAFIEYLARDPVSVERLRVSQNICHAAFPADPWADWVIDCLIRDVQASAERVPVPISKMVEIFNASAAKAIGTKWRESQTKLAAEVTDYVEVIAAVETLIPSHLGIAIAESAHGPRLTYFLALNPSELTRLVSLSPHSCVRELGKIEAMLLRGRAAESLVEWEPGRPN